MTTTQAISSRTYEMVPFSNKYTSTREKESLGLVVQLVNMVDQTPHHFDEPYTYYLNPTNEGGCFQSTSMEDSK